MTRWIEPAPGVRVCQSRAYRMNSTLLLHRDSVVLVDPGVTPAEMDEIAGVAHAIAARDTVLVFTHGHWDHVLGHLWWPGVGCIAHAAFGEETKRFEHHIDRSTREYMLGVGEEWDHLFEHFTPDLAVSGERPVQVGPWSLVFRDAFGHSDSQMSVHLPDQRVLIAADMLSDIELPILNRPPAAYLATLRALQPLVAAGAIETLIPGHGSVTDATGARDRLERDLAYLVALDDGARAARAAGASLDDAQRTLAPLDFIGADAEFPMDEIHRRNVRHAFEAAVDDPA
jgi:hydroxyacylglutathione hydrolase